MDIPWIGLLSLIVAIIGVYYQREQVKRMTAQDITNRQRLWFLSMSLPFSIIVLFVLVLLAWIPWLISEFRSPTSLVSSPVASVRPGATIPKTERIFISRDP